MKNKLTYLVALVVSLLISVQVSATELYTVPVLLDGRKCSDVGVIEGMVKERGPAGITYFASLQGAMIHSGLVIESPFSVAMYDADGSPSTKVSFSADGVEVWQNEFKTPNNAWSDIFTITRLVKSITLYLPLDHASTHLCLLTVTPTPTETPGEPVGTETPVPPTVLLSLRAYVAGAQIPTGSDTAPEPIRPAQYGDGLPYLPLGSTAIVTIEVTNSGQEIANDVDVMVVSGEVTSTVHVGTMSPNQKVIAQYLAEVIDGLNVATLTAQTSSAEVDRSDNTQSVLWFGGECKDCDEEVCGQSCGVPSKLFLAFIKH